MEERKRRLAVTEHSLKKPLHANIQSKKDGDRHKDTNENWSQEVELSLCEDLFSAIMTATDDDNRSLHLVFELLPSKKRYPKYYEVVDNPIDLRMIAQKIQAGNYMTLGEMEKDLLQMTGNACIFNEPNSQIYKDAKALQKYITSKKIKIEHSKKYSLGKTNNRISGEIDTFQNKRVRVGQSISAITAAIKEDESESDEEIVDMVGEEDADNPKWQLYLAVRTARNSQGQELSEPFWRLPSKQYHPDYYKKTKNPLCLMQISNKLKSGEYVTASELAEDMNIMFENAKKYNETDTMLYKDAVILQKLMQAKVQELLELDHQCSAPSNTDYLKMDDMISEDSMEEDPLSKGSCHIINNINTPTPLTSSKDSSSYNEKEYCIGDFVYAEPKERGMDPILLNIQQLWTSEKGQQMMHGNQYFRRHETYPVTTRRFLEKEVFKTDKYIAIPLQQVLARCCVLSMKDYLLYKPENFEEQDVYVCESLYSPESKKFKKIKNWPQSLKVGYTLTPRDKALEPKQVMFVFRESKKKHKETAELKIKEKLMEKENPVMTLNNGSKFAIVQFTDAQDAPGIIALQWTLKNERLCLYPDATDVIRNNLLKDEASPKKSWSSRSIKIIKKCATYNDALQHLRNMEDTSNLEIEGEPYIPSKRRAEVIEKKLHGEDSSSSEGIQKREKLDNPSQSHNLTSSKNNEQLFPMIVKMQATIDSLSEKISQFDKKLDIVLARVPGSSSQPVQNHSEEEPLTYLPLTSMKEFDEFEEKLHDQQFRKLVVQTLVCIGGKDNKTFIFSCMKRCMTTELGMNFSYTGIPAKNVTKFKKRQFQTTSVCTAIQCAVKKLFPSTTEVTLRLHISHWLQQAKYRKRYEYESSNWNGEPGWFHLVTMEDR